MFVIFQYLHPIFEHPLQNLKKWMFDVAEFQHSLTLFLHMPAFPHMEESDIHIHTAGKTDGGNHCTFYHGHVLE